jgi:hypothetical protein
MTRGSIRKNGLLLARTIKCKGRMDLGYETLTYGITNSKVAVTMRDNRQARNQVELGQ